jgi:soluble lytic murein transglycosylase-like protein
MAASQQRRMKYISAASSAVLIGTLMSISNFAQAESVSNEPARLETTKDVQLDAIPAAKPIMPPSPNDIRSSADFRTLIKKETAGTGLPAEIAEAVMAVESGYNPNALGAAGEIGLMQILPSTARMLGFSGSNADLAVPATNVHYGVTYLARAWRLAGGDICTAVMKYRAGHGETRFSYLSVNYCVAVRGKLAARGYQVTGTVPVATFGMTGSTGCGRKCLRGGQVGMVDLVALNTKLNALVMQVKATR